MGDPEAHVMARPQRAPLRRSFSDHIRDSTARALDVIWKNTRDRRLAAVGKSVKLEVDVDKSPEGSNLTPSEVAIGLSPYTSPQEWPFRVPGEEHVAWRVHAWQDRRTPISSAATEIRALHWDLTVFQFHPEIREA
ncbi:rho GTPase-activating protein 7 isoform X8 [Artibeus jamaicensis]|uniref:rho GTPase-activating protein 7 isoform X8 n=1 Tax=Artibeus jamaicensis TaxID=9417 RepID=UPI00235AA1B4|nr:rho GTPase-activating protein 7 isoform X8 [Artibeus jamaicensis]